MPFTATGSQRFRFRPWPCSGCDQGITPVGHLIRSPAANPTSPDSLPEKLAAQQARSLIDWVNSCSHTEFYEVDLPLVATGSEHAVYLDAERAEVYKLTLPDTYGEYYYLVNNRVHQEKCTPIQYLLRMHFWRKLFGASPIPLGVTASGQIVSRQPFISGDIPSQDEVNEYLVSAGLEGIKIPCWLWKRHYPDHEIWVGDARADNFVRTENGIVPIDLRVWLYSYAVTEK